MVSEMNKLPYTQVVTVIGTAFSATSQETVIQFLAILHFLRDIAIAPQGRWTYLDFLELKDTVVQEITDSLKQALNQHTSPAPVLHNQSPPPYSRVSPLINPLPAPRLPSLRLHGSASIGHSFQTIPPTVLDNGPTFISSRGDEDNSVSSPSGEEHLIDEMEMMRLRDEQDLEMIQEQEQDRSYGGSRSLKDLSSQVRRIRSEEYQRYSNPAKPRSKIAVNKMKWDGHRSSYPAFTSDVEGNLLMIGMTYLLN